MSILLSSRAVKGFYEILKANFETHLLAVGTEFNLDLGKPDWLSTYPTEVGVGDAFQIEVYENGPFTFPHADHEVQYGIGTLSTVIGLRVEMTLADVDGDHGKTVWKARYVLAALARMLVAHCSKATLNGAYGLSYIAPTSAELFDTDEGAIVAVMDVLVHSLDDIRATEDNPTAWGTFGGVKWTELP